MAPRSVGIEEEFLLIDPDSGAPSAVAHAVLSAGRDLQRELKAEQVETTTRPRTELGEIRREILACRRDVATAARAVGVAAVPLATCPVPTTTHVADSPRYREMVRRFGLLAAEHLTCGCHVHVSVASDDEAVAVVDRIQPWLAPLVALSANSPFWSGIDTAYASYRSEIQSHWPTAGFGGPFGSAAEYRRVTDELLRTETVLDRRMLLFDARPSHRYPTVEIRVADVCRDPRDTLLLAALVRGLVETSAREWATEQPVVPVRAEMVRLSAWRAARSGLDDVLLLPHDWRPVRADVVIDALIDHITPALSDAGDHAAVCDLWRDLRMRRPGAHHQRVAYGDGGLPGVVRDAVAAATDPLDQDGGC